MSSMQIQQVLAEMRALQARAAGTPAEIAPPGVQAAGTPDFASLMKDSVDRIAAMQNQAIGARERLRDRRQERRSHQGDARSAKSGSCVSRHDPGAQQAGRRIYPSHEHVGLNHFRGLIHGGYRTGGAPRLDARRAPCSSRSDSWRASRPRSPPRSGWCSGRRARTTPCSTVSCPSARAAKSWTRSRRRASSTS